MRRSITYFFWRNAPFLLTAGILLFWFTMLGLTITALIGIIRYTWGC